MCSLDSVVFSCLPARLTLLYLPQIAATRHSPAAQENITLLWAFHLLPWLASGTVAVIVAQLLKADLEKGWAAWLQALVTISVALGTLVVLALHSEEVLPIQTI